MRTLTDVVECTRGVPYGRPQSRTAVGVATEWRGTCSTKHALLQAAALDLFPDIALRLAHRVYRVDPAEVAARYGLEVARIVPAGGVVDVHTYALLERNGRTITIDVTFPGSPWDGASAMPLSCGQGQDFAAGEDPNATKARLVAEYCNPDQREPFIRALSELSRPSSI